MWVVSCTTNENAGDKEAGNHDKYWVAQSGNERFSRERRPYTAVKLLYWQAKNWMSTETSVFLL